MLTKSSTFGCISVTILKDSVDVYLVQGTNLANHSLQTGVFHESENKQKSFHCIKN